MQDERLLEGLKIDLSISQDSHTSLKNEIGDGSVGGTSFSGGEKVEWPLIVLRGDGSIYIVLIGIDTEK